ncbi:acyltransferase [Bradyrhizobium sp. dw_78]|uniref:acyltransferase family protein n=1 Tax=Bradyrhizobium sp. dw_78 TaxID=2719793 RepID=UPI001BD34C24|nr:acyltransferase [Bradyrhizobium sp. dw_78]
MSKPDSSRIDGLDSLRGLAAAVVLVHHCYFILRRSDTGWLSDIRFSPLRLFIAGHAAVIVFFVLSGFVLALPQASKQIHAFDFIVRRTCRIYIPFAAAIFLSAAIVIFVPRTDLIPGAGEGLNFPWPHQLNPSVVAGHLLMLGTTQDVELDPPIWSLVHEYRISLIFLVLLWCIRRRPVITLATTVAAAIAAAAGLVATGDADDGVVITSGTVIGSLLITLRYLPLFIIGAYMALDKRVIAASRAISPAIRFFLMLAGAVLLSGPSVPVWSDIPLTVGAIMLTFVLVSGWQPFFLKAKVSRWLGRVSFSLYLVHVPIIIASCFLLTSIMPVEAAVLLGACLSLLGAQFMYVTVEANAHKLGKYLGNIIQKASPKKVTPIQS